MTQLAHWGMPTTRIFGEFSSGGGGRTGRSCPALAPLRALCTATPRHTHGATPGCRRRAGSNALRALPLLHAQRMPFHITHS